MATNEVYYQLEPSRFHFFFPCEFPFRTSYPSISFAFGPKVLAYSLHIPTKCCYLEKLTGMSTQKKINQTRH